MFQRKTDREIAVMRKAGSILAKVFRYLEKEVIQPGITTGEIDEVIRDMIFQEDCIPAFKGYRGFPGNSCISIDEEVVHGIPGQRHLESGQIVAIDIGIQKDGYFADSAKTFPIGKVSGEKQMLIAVTHKALLAGINAARADNRLYDISSAVQEVAEQAGYGVVRDLVGHGIGKQLHEPPEVPNFGKPHTGPRLQKGMVLAIEPMINMGGYEVIFKDDQWTVVTADGSPSAHFEHTIAVTDGEPLILTAEA